MASQQITSPDGLVWSSRQSDPRVDRYKSFRNYSFASISVKALVPFSLSSQGSQLTEIPLNNLSLFAVSTHRDAYPVTTLGSWNIQGVTRGQGVVAGSLSFSLLNEGPFAALIAEYAKWSGHGAEFYRILPDQLPPFDLLVYFSPDRTTYSDSKNLPISTGAYFLIKNVRILDSSRNVSVNDITYNDSYAFMAEQVTELIDISEAVGEYVVPIMARYRTESLLRRITNLKLTTSVAPTYNAVVTPPIIDLVNNPDGSTNGTVPGVVTPPPTPLPEDDDGLPGRTVDRPKPTPVEAAI